MDDLEELAPLHVGLGGPNISPRRAYASWFVAGSPNLETGIAVRTTA